MEPVDDKTMLMERVIRLVAGLPTESRTRVILTNNLINELWESLDHPPLIYVGDQYEYRMADGSYNVSAADFPQHWALLIVYRTCCILNLERLARHTPDLFVPQSCLQEPCPIHLLSLTP